MACPDENILAELAAGTLPPDQLEGAERHLDSCPHCRQELAALLRMRTSQPGPTDTQGATLADPSKAEVLPNGTLFDRYLVLEKVGEGSLGAVYAAFDPRLDRRVALKLLKAPAFGEAQRERLLKEAQAMAKISHPNVVTVFDAGHVEDRVFLTMEFVDGVNLRHYLASRPSASEVLRQYLEAGEGLAAAHAAGLVHRDFKPDNVLVGRDGRVRVADFGLAAPQAPDEAPGGPVGTPRYMAPEVREGSAADARSDQYSFCVALQEALTGRAPPEPSSPGQPRAVRRVLERGLSPDPAARYPSMDALLAELQPSIGSSRKLALLAAAAALLALAVGVPWQLHRSRLCTGAEGRLAGVWDGPVREAVKAQFSAAGAGLAEGTFARAAPLLDQWTSRWVSMHTAACQATRLKGEQPEAVLELRLACLEGRFQALEALSELWREADRDVVLAAAASARALPAIESCADLTALSSAAALPVEPERRAQVRSLGAKVERARSLLLAGRAAEARDLLSPWLEASRGTGYRTLEADLAATYSEACALTSQLDRAESAALDAVDAAERSADLRLIARARLQLGQVVALRKLRREDADRLFRSAQVAIERAGGAPSLKADLEELKATFHLQVGFPALAHPEYQRALSLREEATGPEDVSLAPALVGLARTALFEQKLEPGWRVHLERALLLQRRALGEEHPDIAQTLRVQGALLEAFGQPAQGLASVRASVAMYERTKGDSVELAIAQDALGIVLQRAGQLDEARQWHEKALALASRFLEPDHPSVLFILNNQVAVANAQSRWEDAYRISSETLPKVEARLGRENLKWAALTMNYCISGILAGKAQVVGPPCLAAHQSVAALLPSLHAPIWELVVARLLASLGRFEEAFAIFDRAEREGDELTQLNARVLSAFARVQAGRRAEEAVRFLRLEQVRLSALGGPEKQLAAQIEAFLAERR